jgi:hypothetical protein
MRTSDIEVQVNFRIPKSIKSALAKSAKNADRSLTAEIVSRLRRSLAETETPDVRQEKAA